MWNNLAGLAAGANVDALKGASASQLLRLAEDWAEKIEAMSPQDAPGVDLKEAAGGARQAARSLRQAIEFPAQAAQFIDDARQSLMMLGALFSVAMGALHFLAILGPGLMFCCGC